MKLAHKNKKADSAAAVVPVSTDWKSAGKLMEDDGDNKQAIELYQSVLKKQSHNAYLYDRLMILYRKEKMYRKELSLIAAGIKSFTELLHPRKNDHAKKVASISKSILQSVGLANKKGQPLYQPQPISRWEKRKKNILHKLHDKG